MIIHASTDENYETQQGGLIKALARSHQVPSFNCRSSALSRTSRTSIVAYHTGTEPAQLRATSPPPPGSAHAIISAQTTVAQDCSHALSLRSQLKTRFADFLNLQLFLTQLTHFYWISVVL